MLSRLRAAAQTLAPPSVLEFWATQPNRTWSLARPLARVVARHAASADAVTLVLQANRRWAGCAPGQHVNVTVEVDGRRLTRSYSPRAEAGAPGRVAITVKRVPGGRVSAHLCDALPVGGVVELGPAYGEMRAPEDDGPCLLLAAGSGVTPMLALVRALAARGLPGPVTLLYWARARAELCFVDELRALAARHPRLTVRFGLTGEAALHADEFAGRLGAGTAALPADVAARRVFACGPVGFVDAARDLLGARARAFTAEAFSAPVFAAATDAPGTVRVTLARAGRTLDVARGKPLLEALEDLGVRPAYGCRRGICNTCACPKQAGATRDLLTGDVDVEPVSALRLCVQAATSDLVLDL